MTQRTKFDSSKTCSKHSVLLHVQGYSLFKRFDEVRPSGLLTSALVSCNVGAITLSKEMLRLYRRMALELVLHTVKRLQ